MFIFNENILFSEKCKLIGEGSRSLVYKLNNNTVIKKLNSIYENKLNYISEIKMLEYIANNCSVNIPKLLGKSNDYKNIVLEYIDGVTIFNYIKTFGLSEDLISKIIDDIISMSSVGVLANDLHAENILIVDDKPYYIDVDRFTFVDKCDKVVSRQSLSFIEDLYFIGEIEYLYEIKNKYLEQFKLNGFNIIL